MQAADQTLGLGVTRSEILSTESDEVDEEGYGLRLQYGNLELLFEQQDGDDGLLDRDFVDVSARFPFGDDDARWRAYFLAGPGWYNSDIPLPSGGRFSKDSFSLHSGVGLEYRFADRWHLRPELRLRLFEHRDFDFGDGDLGVALGVSYRFGTGDRLRLPPLQVELVKVAPAEQGTPVFAPLTPLFGGALVYYRARLRAWFVNSGSRDLRLERLTAQPVYPWFSGQVFEKTPKEEEVVFSVGRIAEVTLPHMTTLLAEPESLALTLYFEESTLVSEFDVPVAERREVYAFPSQAADLDDDVYWVTNGGWHALDCGNQTFFYDLSGIQWDHQTASWVKKLGSANSDYAIWNARVRSIGGGEIVDCRDGHPDNPSPPQRLPRCSAGVTTSCRSGDPGGNYVIVRLDNGEEVKYSHLREGSLTERAIYPSCSTAPIRVEQGDVVGQVGNSGRSSGPHLHIGVRRTDPALANVPRCDQPAGGDSKISQPLLFKGGKTVALKVLKQHEPGELIPWAELNGQSLSTDTVVQPP